MPTNREGYMKAYYEAHREQIRAYQRAYHQAHKEEHNSRQRAYARNRKAAQAVSNPRLFDMREDFIQQTKEDFKAVPQQRSSYQKDYYDANKERIREYQRAYREKKKRRDYQRAYYEANKERITAQQREYHSKKAKEKRMSKTFLGRVALKMRKFFS